MIETDTSTGTRTVVETFFQRLAAGDPEPFTALFAEEIDWLIPGDTSVAPWVGWRNTRSGVAEYLRLLRTNVEPIRAEVQPVLVDGDVAIAAGEFASRMLGTGKGVESIFFAQFLVRDGLIVRYRLLEDSHAVVVALTAYAICSCTGRKAAAWAWTR
jgi:ketosteroid isomerase-like protein